MFGRPTVRIACAVLVAATSVLGCARSVAVAAVAGVNDVPRGSVYVAMGSSYAAGAAILPLDAGSGACGRSFVNYPHLVAAKLHVDLHDVSCGGAVTANARDTSQDGQPPQIEAVTANTRLVTITIGGNDVGFVDNALRCGVLGDACATTANREAINADFRKLPHSLIGLIGAIRERAPHVTIVLVSYPRLVPPKPCAALNYTPAGRRFVGSIGARLEKMFVEVARVTKILIADPYVLGAQHGPCASSAQRWVVGLAPHNCAPYHPTAAGHREMARLVERALSSG